LSKGEQFENLIVWQKAMALVLKIYQCCQREPLSRDWGMRDQMQRAAVSVPANIAEGYERASRKEYAQFLMISKGSAGELRCLLQIASGLKYIDEALVASFIDDSLEISRMLKGLANSLQQ
jgi:four helix bundle protein